jgi:cytochrome c
MIARMLVVVPMIAISACAAAAQDAAKGEIVFHQCMICHAIGGNAQNKIRPELYGLDGRHSGTVMNYNYSDANKNSGIVWDETIFKKYIVDPRAMIPGTKIRRHKGLPAGQRSVGLYQTVMPTAASRIEAADR